MYEKQQKLQGTQKIKYIHLEIFMYLMSQQIRMYFVS